jgi:MinD superfamily P-loop ATPase
MHIQEHCLPYLTWIVLTSAMVAAPSTASIAAPVMRRCGDDSGIASATLIDGSNGTGRTVVNQVYSLQADGLARCETATSTAQSESSIHIATAEHRKVMAGIFAINRAVASHILTIMAFARSC